MTVIGGNAEFIPLRLCHSTLAELEVMVELNVFRLLDRLSVDMDHAVYNLKPLTGQAYSALHLILTAVNRTIDNLAESLWITENVLTSVSPH